MTDHETVMLHAVGWAEVNGHEGLIFHNVSTREMNVHCQGCGWISATATRRHGEDFLDKQWRLHAGDLAVGITITHGQLGNGCHCVTCLIAAREAAAISSGTGTTTTTHSQEARALEEAQR